MSLVTSTPRSVSEVGRTISTLYINPTFDNLKPHQVYAHLLRGGRIPNH